MHSRKSRGQVGLCLGRIVDSCRELEQDINEQDLYDEGTRFIGHWNFGTLGRWLRMQTSRLSSRCTQRYPASSKQMEAIKLASIFPRDCLRLLF